MVVIDFINLYTVYQIAVAWVVYKQKIYLSCFLFVEVLVG